MPLMLSRIFWRLVRAYDHSLALNPGFHVSWNNAADAAIGTQRFDHAYQYALMALTLAPGNETCLLNFAALATVGAIFLGCDRRYPH